MRNFIASLFNIAGVCLLVAAAIVAWKTYAPAELPPVPADVTVDAPAPTALSERPAPPPAQSSATASPAPVTAESTPAAPVLLPETPPLPLETSPSGQAQADVPSPADRKQNAGDLAAARAGAFPPAAQSLPTRLVLPSIQVDSPVVEVGWKTSMQNGQLLNEWEVADYAVGFLKNGALPGAPGNTVMAGHNNINGEVFKNLIDLKIGDDVFVYVGQTAYRFVVKQKLLLKEAGVPMEQRLQNAQWIAPTNDLRLTLVSCWPYTSNTHRVIIVATPAV